MLSHLSWPGFLGVVTTSNLRGRGWATPLGGIVQTLRGGCSSEAFRLSVTVFTSSETRFKSGHKPNG